MGVGGDYGRRICTYIYEGRNQDDIEVMLILTWYQVMLGNGTPLTGHGTGTDAFKEAFTVKFTL